MQVNLATPAFIAPFVALIIGPVVGSSFVGVGTCTVALAGMAADIFPTSGGVGSNPGRFAGLGFRIPKKQQQYQQNQREWENSFHDAPYFLVTNPCSFPANRVVAPGFFSGFLPLSNFQCAHGYRSSALPVPSSPGILRAAYIQGVRGGCPETNR